MRWQRTYGEKKFCADSVLKMAKVSSTWRKYRFARLLVCQNNSFSWYSTKILASGESIAALSVCLYDVSLKLNSTNAAPAVANSIKSTLEIAGGTNSLLYKASIHICIVFVSGIIVNRLKVSQERYKMTSGFQLSFCIVSAKVKESLIKLLRK